MKMLVFVFMFVIMNNADEVSSKSDSLDVSADTTDYRNSYQQEILLESNLSEDEHSEALDYLENLRRNPYDLNRAALEELESIPFIGKLIAANILKYRKAAVKFKSKRELLKVEGITEELYERIKTYLIVPKSSSDVLIDETGNRMKVTKVVKRMNFSVSLRSRFIQDLQVKKGFLNGDYTGSKLKSYNRLNAKYSGNDFKLEANFTSEKDPGEDRFADFTSGFLELRNYGFIKTAVAGDYTLNFSQGLALWTSSSFSKGIDAVSPLKKRGKGIDGYSSSDENQFFRGAAIELAYNNFNLNLFYSDRYFDATVDTVTGGVKGIYIDGYHRTASEIKRENSLKEKLTGGRISFAKDLNKFGFTYWQSTYSNSILDDTVKKLYAFSGKKAYMLGVDYDFILHNINLFGEIAMSQSKSVAYINSLQFTFPGSSEIVLSYRNYPYEFAAVHSYGFSERNSITSNETGFYAGITLKPLKGLLINAYFDQFKFPYRSYFTPVSVIGNDLLASVEWKAAKGFLLNLKYKNESKEESRTVKDDYGRDMKKTENRNQLNLRSGFIYRVTEKFRIRSRIEYVSIKYKNFGGSSKGILFFTDARIIPAKGIAFDFRYIIFDTDDYDSRIYEFENDIRGVMSNTALYGKGRRWYFLVKYKPFPFFEFSGKYAETYKDGVKSTGTGNDEIRSDVNNRVSFGVEIIF